MPIIGQATPQLHIFRREDSLMTDNFYLFLFLQLKDYHLKIL